MCETITKTNRTRNVIVRTTKKSAETKVCLWFFRKVRQCCDGGFRCRTMYFASVACDTCRPSFNSSPAMRGAPQPWLARLIRRSSSATSPDTDGRPAGGRLFHLPYSRNPCRCQPMTVSGLTISNADRHSVDRRASQTERARSAQPKRSLWPRRERCRTRRG